MQVLHQRFSKDEPWISLAFFVDGKLNGNLIPIQQKRGQNYEEDLREYADRLTAQLGPILLILMALIVGFIVLSIAQPMTLMLEQAGAF